MSDQIIGEVLAEVTRNGAVESLHTGHLVMLNQDGSVYKVKGSPDLPIFPRSSVKCMQASAMVRNGLKLSQKHLALAAASHSGSKMHQDAVLEILAGAGVDESALQNSSDKPLGDLERANWGQAPATRVAMNCSGKHAAMIATCVVNGWDIKTYLTPTHPLQIAILAEIEGLTGERVINETFDGCGAPLFAIRVMALAKGIHDFTVSKDPVHQEVLSACLQYPEVVAGEGRLTTRMMQAIPGLFMKEGAEGVEVASLSDGRTLVFKISDGSLRAFSTIIHAAFAEWGINTPEDPVNVYGGASIIGGIRATI